MSEATKETVTGVLDGITEKPTGWTEISVRVDGWQYPVKMSTKLQPLIEQKDSGAARRYLQSTLAEFIASPVPAEETRKLLRGYLK